MEILIYGIYPPPIGGVSIHLKRFVEFLRSRGTEFEFAHANPVAQSGFSQLRPLELFRRALASRARIVHVHGFQHARMHLLLAVLAILFRKRIVITIHNERFPDDYRCLQGLERWAARLCYASVARIIAVNAETDFLFVPKDRIVHIPAFLPPMAEETDPSALPRSVHELRRRMGILLTANAFRISFLQGRDLYGLELSIELMRRLCDAGHDDVGFVFAIPDVGHPDYLEAMRRCVEEHGLGDRFLFVTVPVPYPALIQLCDLFLRPTLTDGDAISVREALCAGIRTIASDAVRRPEGVVLFKTGDAQDLLAKTVMAIEDCRRGRRPAPAHFAQGGEEVLEVYRALGARV